MIVIKGMSALFLATLLLLSLLHVALAEEVLTCDNVSNFLGTCECDPQFFMDNDCKRAFYCNSANAGENSEGCMLECTGDDEYVLYDEESQTVGCTSMAGFVCPGFFQYDCFDNLQGPSYFPDDAWCNCAGEFWVNGDCTEGYMCTELNMPGFNFDCTDDNTRLQVQPSNGIASCIDTDDFDFQCHGPFHYGCPRDNPNFGPGVVCSDNLVNPLGTCECDPQAFISDDCKTAFLCTEQFSGENSDGCILECSGEEEYISYDPETQSLSCVTAALYTCPRSFEYDCRGDLPQPNFFPEDQECGCAGEIWVNGDCSQFHVCSGVAVQDGDQTPGYTIDCEGDNKALFNLGSGAISCVDPVMTPFDYKCYGPYHFGCGEPEIIPDDTTDGATVASHYYSTCIAIATSLLLFVRYNN